MESRKLVAWLALAWPRLLAPSCGTEAVGPPLVGTEAFFLPGRPSLVHWVAAFPVVGGAGKSVCG